MYNLGAYYRFSFKSLKIRLLAASWCLASFVLVAAYSSVLISFVLSPHASPIINSFSDIPDNPKVKLVTEKGGTMQMLLLVRINQVIISLIKI